MRRSGTGKRVGGRAGPERCRREVGRAAHDSVLAMELRARLARASAVGESPAAGRCARPKPVGWELASAGRAFVCITHPSLDARRRRSETAPRPSCCCCCCCSQSRCCAPHFAARPASLGSGRQQTAVTRAQHPTLEVYSGGQRAPLSQRAGRLWASRPFLAADEASLVAARARVLCRWAARRCHCQALPVCC